MEHECFEDMEVAEKLNGHFVSIKVDREERPDIDSIYMSVCQSLTGRGGWPLSVFVTPDAKPFYAGTYFPKRDRFGVPGFLSVLDTIAGEWRKNKDNLSQIGNRVISALSDDGKDTINSGGLPDFKSLPPRAYEALSDNFDEESGGFGTAPKFPSPHNLMFLLRYWHATGSGKALSIVEKTLEMMYRGGIYDHIGFGFCRYSTDEKWLVPHFEKMLYDNALLAICYLEAFQASGNPLFENVAMETLDYVLRDMTSPEGGFYSAEDADSEGVEGKFYLWTVDEIVDVLGREKGSSFCRLYGITKSGNFADENIPNLIGSGIPNNWSFVRECRQLLLDRRETRIRPLLDDKVLTSWNGLMIAAMAMGGRITGKSEYSVAAEKAAAFILGNMVDKNGRLLARYRDGEAGIPAYADDYSNLIWGLLELFATTYNQSYLEQAVALNTQLLELFQDDKQGGVFLYGNDAEQLITRPKEAYDGAIPSANSVSAMNMLRLSRLTGRHELEDKAHSIFGAFSHNISPNPSMHTHMMSAILFADSQSEEIIITGDPENKVAAEMLDILSGKFMPFSSVILYSGQNRELKNTVPYLEDYATGDGQASAYICKGHACSQPVHDAISMESLLSGTDTANPLV